MPGLVTILCICSGIGVDRGGLEGDPIEFNAWTSPRMLLLYGNAPAATTAPWTTASTHSSARARPPADGCRQSEDPWPRLPPSCETAAPSARPRRRSPCTMSRQAPRRQRSAATCGRPSRPLRARSGCPGPQSCSGLAPTPSRPATREAPDHIARRADLRDRVPAHQPRDDLKRTGSYGAERGVPRRC